MKVILKQDIKGKGKKGQMIEAAEGYARNFLLPRKLAAKATPGTLRLIESRKVQIAARRAQELADAKALAEKLAGIELSIPMQATDDEQLFGSVTARMVADQLAVQGFSIDHNRVKMDPIKTLGPCDVEVKLHKDVDATLKVWVVRG